MKTDATFLGVVARVNGAKVEVDVSTLLPSTAPIVNGRIYRIGQVGSFVRISLGYVDVFGAVERVSSNEILDEAGQRTARRLLEVQLVGEAVGGMEFVRGVSEYPTIDDEVHVITGDDLARIHRSLRSKVPVAIGSHASSESLPAIVDLERLVTRHCAIVGSTGSGKSNAVASLLRAVTSGGYPSARVVVIDPHGEYGSALAGVSKVFRVNDPSQKLVIPYWALSFDELAWFLVDRRTAAETAPDAKLRELIHANRCGSAATCKSVDGKGYSANEITADAPIPFDIRGLWYNLDREERKTWADQARTKEAIEAEGDAATLRSARFTPAGASNALPHKHLPVPPMAAYANRILGRLRDPRFDFLTQPGEFDGVSKDLDDLVASWIDHDAAITVLDLAGVPSEVTDLVVGLLTRILFETMFWGRDLDGLGRQRPLLMVFEEAHSYLPRGENQGVAGYARRAVQRVLKEGRKYGIGAVVVTQRPSELDDTVLSQCGTFLALRLTNSQDQGRVAAMVPDDVAGLTALLPALRTGEAIVAGEAIGLPSRVRIRLMTPRPDSADPEVGQRWSMPKQQGADTTAAITAWRRQRKLDVSQPDSFT